MLKRTQFLDELNADFEHLKTISKHPRLFLRMHFQALKNELDNLSMSQSETKLLIDRITLFETECFNHTIKSTTISETINDKIKYIRTILNDFNEEEEQQQSKLADETHSLIHSEIFQLEKALFLNKTIFFRNDKLIIVNNTYLGRRVIESLKKARETLASNER